MATTKKPAAKSTGDSHQDVDTLTSSAVADPHAKAFGERQRDTRYDDPTVATPGVLEDVDEDAGQPTALVDADAPSGLDVSVDNRDQVQPMIDMIVEDIGEDPAQAVAAINPHESDAVDVEAQLEEQAAKRDQTAEDLNKQREDARSATATKK